MLAEGSGVCPPVQPGSTWMASTAARMSGGGRVPDMTLVVGPQCQSSIVSPAPATRTQAMRAVLAPLGAGCRATPAACHVSVRRLASAWTAVCSCTGP